tara:strand:- start:799 stop:927 length:129 start_codon:yes stop_codon:yes gene_type:complete
MLSKIDMKESILSNKNLSHEFLQNNFGEVQKPDGEEFSLIEN